ncbi:MAG: exodeoxyribonuclease III, partial [Cellulomonadaceae bacterium]|nr:exodeoxyribonuclease III [Cellulomonadaceae bacterium]
MLSIATVNVNGIRAAFRKGMGEWLAERAPDVVLMQETRAPEDIVASFFPEEAGWHLAVHPCEIKGRAGVAIASRLPVMASRVGLIQGDGSDEPPVDTGRWIEADLALGGGQAVTVVSTYFHSGTNTPEMQHTMDAKYAHLAKADARLVELVGRDHPVIVA